MAGNPNIIPVQLTLNPKKFPRFADAWRSLNGGRQTIHWRAPIPTYAISKIQVPSSEQAVRMLGLSKQFSNVSLPVSNIDVNPFELHAAPVGAEAEKPALDLPEALNATQGAMAMAVWAAPSNDRWMELVCCTLEQDLKSVRSITRALNAQWMQVPWLLDNTAPPDNAQEALWRAALASMRCPSPPEAPDRLAERIAQQALDYGESHSIKTWLQQTRRILRAEEPVSCNESPENTVRLAIQLALLRPDPSNFETWGDVLPKLPPEAWWSAAILCGWRHGHLALDKRFRGGRMLQELISTRALAASWPDRETEVLPAVHRYPIKQKQEGNRISLTWKGETVWKALGSQPPEGGAAWLEKGKEAQWSKTREWAEAPEAGM